MKKKLAWNTGASLLNQIMLVVYGFVLPHLILRSFGTEINGLINSIEQFLKVISLLELGVGAVIRSALYKPLAEHDNVFVSEIVASGEKFFRTLAMILLGYIVVLAVVYPKLANSQTGYFNIVILIISMSISSFAQYYFGMVDGLLLTADQRGYVNNIAQTVTLAVNTFVCAIVIGLGGSINAVKIATSLIFMFRPLILRWYVNKNYKINRKIKYTSEPIKQKWNGVAQHIASYILNGTDIIVLTVFSTLTDVSIYSVYYMVIGGVKELIRTLLSGVQAAIGNLWARQQLEKLNEFFGIIEWCIHMGTVFVFGCTAMLVIPFVKVYTYGVTDANYIASLFSILLTLANAMYCLRLPYNIMILAGGHYKETQNNYVIAAVMNVVISVILVKSYGLIGVAIGTLAAMAYQTVWMAHYISKQLLKWPFANFIRQLIMDIFIVCVGVLLTKDIIMNGINYISWLVMALKVASIWIGIIIIINILFNCKKLQLIANKISGRKS
jgi:O-antigen/teichoic acid export membrane protein